MTPRILTPDAALDSPHAGGKARALAHAARAGLPVPPWFVISAETFVDAPTDFSLDGEAAREITAAAARLADGKRLAVRSSASDEDGVEHSFAGQLESYLNIPPEDVVPHVCAVWRSGFTDRILAYRRERGLDPTPRAPAVIVQQMVTPRAAGVAFSADPVTGRRGVTVVSAVPGLGFAVVSGEADTDVWHLDRTGGIIERTLVAGAGLTENEVRSVADLARTAERHFGRPQDIEWALSDQLYLLQSRPITSLRRTPDPDAPLVIWDNSNIVESYSGVTTPLTFSFAREIYEHVYRQFCRMMGVPEKSIAAHDDMFRNMLGLIRGRLYYNLLNWYRMLALLPGYRLNRRFMEQMMGVKETLPDHVADTLAREERSGKLLDFVHLARTVARLGANHFSLNRRVDAFYRRLELALAQPDPPLERRRIDELVAHYRDLRSQLLLTWDAPIVNDFFAMIFYGVLRTLVTRWCGDAGGTLQNDLIGGEGGIVSAEPAVRMRHMGSLAAQDPELRGALATGTVADITRLTAEREEFRRLCLEYLAKFGDRTVNELKLESSTLHDDPLPLYRAIGTLAQPSSPRDVHESTSADRLRTDSKRRVKEALSAHPVRRAVFMWVLKHAQRRVRDRENLRLERTRLFGRVRRIFLEIGRRFHAEGLLDDPRDIFYLEVDEVLAFADGRATTTDLRALSRLRKNEFAKYAEGEPPPDRFEVRGSAYQWPELRSTLTATTDSGDEKRGLGCSPGVVRGVVRVVRDPTAVDQGHNAILVAEHTDPGWIMIFPAARGVLVERGSLLSHAAIVARELGIPAVVSLPGLTRWLRDGDDVEMDGSTGVVRRLSRRDEGDAQ